VAWSRARELCTEGRVTVNGERCLDSALRVPPGAVVVVDERAPKLRPGALPESAIAYFDRDVRRRRQARRNAEHCLRARRQRHARRLPRGPCCGECADAAPTAGSAWFTGSTRTRLPDGVARTAEAMRILAAQFRAHDIERVYHAIAHGAVAAERGRNSSGRGSRRRNPRLLRALSATQGGVPPDAKAFGYARQTDRSARGCDPGGVPPRNRAAASDFASTCPSSAIPWVGERVYIRDYADPKIESARPMLHARVLGFVHPERANACRSSAKPPTTSGP